MARKKKQPSLFRRFLKRVIVFVLILWAASVAQVLALRFVNPPFTVSMAWAWIKNGGRFDHLPLHYSWRPLEDISPHLRKAVLAGEDQRFLSHRGFDFTEMNRAIRDMALKRGVRGASTITMQVARTVYLWPDRTVVRKALEAYYTVLIELLWSKRRILEIYLNTVDWGTGIIGAEEASRKYFNLSCFAISRSQAAMLAAILPSPHRWSPARPPPHVLKRRIRILRDMEKMPLV